MSLVRSVQQELQEAAQKTSTDRVVCIYDTMRKKVLQTISFPSNTSAYQLQKEAERLAEDIWGKDNFRLQTSDSFNSGYVKIQDNDLLSIDGQGIDYRVVVFS